MAVLAELFGSNKSPKNLFYPGTRNALNELTGFDVDILRSLRSAIPAVTADFAAGRGQQEDLLNQQANLFQGLMRRNAESNPLGLYQGVTDTLFNTIKPNVLDPIANFEVNKFRADNMARLGTNDAVINSTTRRLADSANANRVWADLAKSIYPNIAPGFNQVFNAGLSQDSQSTGLIPQLMQGYRNFQLSPLIPALAGLEAAGGGNQLLQGLGGANKANIFGVKQPTGNIFDKIGGATDDVLGLIGTIYGMGGFGGGGGGGGDGGTISIGGGNPGKGSGGGGGL